MSSSPSGPEDLDDQHTDTYLDAEEGDDNEDDEEDEEDDDDDDIVHGLFNDEPEPDFDCTSLKSYVEKPATSLTREVLDAEEGNLGFIVHIEGGAEGQGGESSEEANSERGSLEQRIISLIASAYPVISLNSLAPDTQVDVGRRAGLVSQREIMNLLRGQRQVDRARFARAPRFPKVPSERGRELMNSGTFGASDLSSPLGKKKQLARRILDRELGIGGRSYRRINQGVIAQASLTA